MKIVKEKSHYEIQLNTDSDRSTLLTLKDKNHVNYIGEGVNVIYIYSLVDDFIQYPNKKGSILYIGEACKYKEPTGLRFSQHISSSPNKGRNRNGNYTLHKYYWGGSKIAVDIFDLGSISRKQRKKLEKILIHSHVKIYGTLPIAQGTSGLLVSYINSLDESKVKAFFR